MHCINNKEDFPDGFQETVPFLEKLPYTIRMKEFNMADVVPLHYGKTMEILLCTQLAGEITIGSQHYTLDGNQVFVIPPDTVHANTIEPCKGYMRILKINFAELNRYIHTENFLAISNVQLHQLLHQCPDYTGISDLVEKMIAGDGDLMLCLSYLLQIFYTLSHYRTSEQEPILEKHFRNGNLQDLIRWTSENYSRKISLEEAADFTGYNKYHFCCRFKALTGMTYLQYLTSVRLSNACKMLLNGDSIQSVSRACGFDNVSYFIQVFKHERSITPHQYVLQQQRSME